MTTQLPPQGPPEPDEKLPGEAELAALYRQLPQSEPSPALDAAVLRAAAQALTSDEESPTMLRERRKAERERGDWVHPKPVTPSPVASPSAGNNRRRPRWLIALSSAATLVLAAGLAWHMRELSPATSTPVATDSAAPAQATAPASLPPAAAMQSAEPAPPPPAEPPKQPPPKIVVASSRAPATYARKAAADQSAERASSKVSVLGGLSRPAPTPMPAPPAPPSPPAALQETSSNAVEYAPEAPAMAAAPAPITQPVQEATLPNTSDTPAQELDKIQQLFKQGHDDEARQRLTAFQHAHPQWDLPPELREQLRKP
jgi:hypothetical protein